MLRFYWYLRHKNATTHATARECLEFTVKVEPGYADAWASLSWIIADEKRLGYNADPQAGDPLTRSLHAAEQAVEHDPRNAMAYLYLGTAQFALGHDEAARGSLIRALALNSNDANLLANAGTTLALMGSWQQGVALMHKAIALNPGHPRWYFGILFVDAYREQDYAQALKQAKAYYRPDIVLSHAFLVAAYVMARHQTEAQDSARRAARLFPEFRQVLEEQFRLWRLPGKIADSISDGLRKAGMDPGS